MRRLDNGERLGNECVMRRDKVAALRSTFQDKWWNGHANVIRMMIGIYEFVQSDVAAIGKTLITNSRHLRQES